MSFKKTISILAILIVAPSLSDGQEVAKEDDNSFGGWIFTEVNHDFKNGLYVTGYFEHDNYQFQRLECNYFRLSTGYKIFPWLKVGVNYVPVSEPGHVWLHYGEVDVMGTLKSGDFKVSIRERYRHGFTNGKNELRSRLKVAYSINEKWGIYLAPEVFTWGQDWKKTRHYCACTYNVTDWMQAEAYYLYYAFKNDTAEHVIGFGLNFDF